MPTGEGSFASTQEDGPRIVHLPERRYAVRVHPGDEHNVDDTRRPMYQYLIMNELVAGPSALRFRPDGIDVLVGCAAGFDGDEGMALEIVQAGSFAIFDYEGPATGLPAARDELAGWVQEQGHTATGPVLQVHMMDAMDDGMAEQQLQIPVSS